VLSSLRLKHKQAKRTAQRKARRETKHRLREEKRQNSNNRKTISTVRAKQRQQRRKTPRPTCAKPERKPSVPSHKPSKTMRIPTPELGKIMHAVYYKDKVILGRDRLYQYVRKNYANEVFNKGMSRRRVYTWLKQQEIHQLFAQAPTTRKIQPTVLQGPFRQLALDTTEFTEYGGYKAMLTGVDLFSKRAMAVPITGKTAEEVVRGLTLFFYGGSKQSIINKKGYDAKYMDKWEMTMEDTLKSEPLSQCNRIPRHLRTDNGVEMQNSLVARFLENHTQPFHNEKDNLLPKPYVTQHFSLPHTPQSNGGIERLNKTVKRMLKMRMTQFDDPNWPAMLPDIIRVYNASWHSSIRRTPDDVEQHYLADASTSDAVRCTIEHRVDPNTKRSRGLGASLFCKGDIVRVRLDWAKSYGHKWSRQLYRIAREFRGHSKSADTDDILAPFCHVTYQLEEYDVVTETAGERDERRYYNDQLQAYVPVDEQEKVKAPETYLIERLERPHLKHVGRHYEQFYHVKWKGYRQSTEEPRSTLMIDVPKLVRKFENVTDLIWHNPPREPSWKQ
jgi:hypothetical protein